MQQLIVNGDDLGITAGVSKGILEAHQNGIVTSTSVIIGGPDAARAVSEALQFAPKLGIGLHFTISGQVPPVLPPQQIPSLVGSNGTFHPIGQWLKNYEQLNPDDIRREMEAQVNRFIEIAGKPPDHLDGHHHAVYRHPAGVRALFDLAAKYHVPIRNLGFDPSTGSVDSVLRSLLNGVPTQARDLAIEAIKGVIKEGPIPPWPNRFEADFYDKTATLGDLLLTLTNLSDGVTEIMCHPGYADDSLHSDYTAKRQTEINILTHSSVKELIRAHGIELVNYSVLS